MDNADYLDVALRLANASLHDVDALRAALHDEPWWADRAGSSDLEALRPVAAALRAALEAAVAGDAEGVLSRVNALLAAHPPAPRLSAHGGHWHVHVASPDAPPATEVAAAAAWGLAQGVVRHALDRWGTCPCGNHFLDASTNRAKRFCSTRCANRANVAAFRARNRG